MLKAFTFWHHAPLMVPHLAPHFLCQVLMSSPTINGTTFWHHMPLMMPLMVPCATNSTMYFSMHHMPLNAPCATQCTMRPSIHHVPLNAPCVTQYIMCHPIHHVPSNTPCATQCTMCHSMHHVPLNVRLNFQTSPADKIVACVMDSYMLNYALLPSECVAYLGTNLCLANVTIN